MGPKKRKTKKQVQEEEQEALRLAQLEAAEQMRQKLARLHEIRKLEEQAKLREVQEMKEHNLRLAVLTDNKNLFEKIKSIFINGKIKQRESEEWNRYLRCDRLPNPSVPSSMNSHLSYWSNLKEAEFMDNVLDWVEKYIIILSDIEKLIGEPLDASQRTIENWLEVRQSYRSEISRKFDQATFHILRKIQSKMNRIDYWTVDFKRITKSVKIFMWAWLTFPISDSNKRDPPNVDFPEIGITVRLPKPYDRKFVVIRVIHVSFDPLSDTSKTWLQPPILQEGKLSEIVDFWQKRKIELQKLQWSEEAKKLEMEKMLLKAEERKPKKKVKAHLGRKSSPPPSMRKEERQSSGKVESKEISEERTLPKDSIENICDERDEIEYLADNSLEPKLILKENLHQKTEFTLNDLKNIDELDEEYFAAVKPDILGCFFVLPNSKTASMPRLAQLVLKGEVSNINQGLQSLKMETKIKDFICKYFKILPLLDLKKGEEMSQLLSDIPDTRENTILKQIRQKLAVSTTAHETNLRKFTILGGVYYLDLINQIYQRFPLKDGSSVQIQFGKYEIERDNFVFIYEPPKIEETNEDEEEKPPPDDNIDKLIHVEISLPEQILWFEAPSPVLWHNEEKIWSNQHVYDIKFNEEKQKIIFKVGRTLPIGLSAVRYNNLPFQTWELRPGVAGSNTVFFSLTASTVILEFVIKGDTVALESLQNATGAALEPILGKFFPPNELINIMKRGGIDVFPEHDAFLYIEGHSLKDYIIEEHVYMSMAMFSPFFQFSWSRWNMLAGWGTLVYQIRQFYRKKHLPNYCMVMSNLYRTTIVACSEVSPAFSEESIPNIGFNPDLYSLLKNVSSKKIKPLINQVEVNLINTVYEITSKTKFFSYS